MVKHLLCIFSNTLHIIVNEELDGGVDQFNGLLLEHNKISTLHIKLVTVRFGILNIQQQEPQHRVHVLLGVIIVQEQIVKYLVGERVPFVEQFSYQRGHLTLQNTAWKVLETHIQHL